MLTLWHLSPYAKRWGSLFCKIFDLWTVWQRLIRVVLQLPFFFSIFFFSLLCHNFLWVIMRALHRHGFTIFFSRKYCCPYFTEVCLSKLRHEMVISEMQPDGMHHGLCLFQGFVIREVIFWLIIVLWWQHLFSNFDRLC